MQPPTPTMVPWLPKQLKNKFDNVRIDKYVLPKDELSSDCDNEVCVDCDTCSNTITVVLNH